MSFFRRRPPSVTCLAGSALEMLSLSQSILRLFYEPERQYFLADYFFSSSSLRYTIKRKEISSVGRKKKMTAPQSSRTKRARTIGYAAIQQTTR
jgi:hypothetical protein